jgi:hypothetical protein
MEEKQYEEKKYKHNPTPAKKTTSRDDNGVTPSEPLRKRQKVSNIASPVNDITPQFRKVIRVRNKHDNIKRILASTPRSDIANAVRKAGISDVPNHVLVHRVGRYMDIDGNINYSMMRKYNEDSEHMLIHAISKNSERYWTFLQVLNDQSPIGSYKVNFARKHCYGVTKDFITHAIRKSFKALSQMDGDVMSNLVIQFIDRTNHPEIDSSGTEFPNDNHNYTTKFVYRHSSGHLRMKQFFHQWYTHTKEWTDEPADLMADHKANMTTEHNMISYICSNYMHLESISVWYMGRYGDPNNTSDTSQVDYYVRNTKQSTREMAW